VKAIEFHPTGEVKRVEFVTGSDYPPLSQRWPHSASNMGVDLAPLVRPSLTPNEILRGVATLSQSKAPP
jgi:hypothetical protein